jgi:hypothetical protein
MPEQRHDQVVDDRHEELVWYRRGVTQETLDQHGRAKISHQRADRAQRYLAPFGSARQYQPEDVEPGREDTLIHEPDHRPVPLDFGEQALHRASDLRIEHYRLLAHVLDQVVADVAPIGGIFRRGKRVVEGVRDQFGLTGPAAVEGRLAGAGGGPRPQQSRAVNGPQHDPG